MSFGPMSFGRYCLVAFCLLAGCAHQVAPVPVSGPRVLLSYEDGRTSGMVVFPNNQYESIMRFELPAGEHRLLRVWLQAASAGQIAVTFYDTNPLDSPGEPIGRVEKEILAQEVSNGKDSLWVVQDLSTLPPCKGIIWLGMKKLAGTPTIWSSRVVSGRYFLRSDGTDLLPVKETPLARLEISP